MRASRAILSLTALVLIGTAGPAVAAPPAERITPHRALYNVALVGTSSSSEIVDVRGRMGFEWRDDCEGWAIEQRYLMAFSRASGEGYEIRSTYTTWESKAGDNYRFIVERLRGGGTERLEGRAVMPLPLGSGAGKAVFTAPSHEEILLQPDTMMPTEHTIQLIAAARDGRRFFRATVFDGSEVEAGSLVSAVIGPARTEPAPIEHPALTGAYWPIRLAFFDVGEVASAPNFEMSVDLLANGIARRLVLDYADFRVAMTLEKLETLDSKAC